MNINEVHWNFSNNGTKEPAKPDFEYPTSLKPLYKPQKYISVSK